MAKALSLDLRRRVFAAWQEGQDSQAAVAERFQVSTSFVRDLSRRFRESGSVAAKPRAGGKPPLASARTLECLQGLVACQPDAPPSANTTRAWRRPATR